MLFVDDSDPMGAPGRPRVSGERPPRDNGRKRSHWMISSARTRTDWGIVTPSALAVLRLTTSSNFVGSSTGRSAGSVPHGHLLRAHERAGAGHGVLSGAPKECPATPLGHYASAGSPRQAGVAGLYAHR